MSRQNPAHVIAPIVCLALVACSGQSPVSPSAPADGVAGLSALAAKGVPGSYALSFLAFINGTLQPVSTLPAGDGELILNAHVAQSSGAPAQTGSVIFEYCSLKGLPPNDITRADEAPSDACATGLGSWARLSTVQISAGTCPGLGPGNACMTFGVVRLPRTVGFRFRYLGQGSVIASGVSAPMDFTWQPAG
jgi:hypothetical protein